MLNTFVIALREGLEASLIVGILVAYLRKSQRTALLRSLWGGVFAAIALALSFGAILTFTSASLGRNGEPAFAGIAGTIAVVLVTWMVFWMKKTARFMKRELEQKASTAISAGALAFAAFSAVAREGLETSLFLYANFKAGSSAIGSTIGLLLGLAAAITLGYSVYRGSIKFNLSTFFKISGVALILVAANVLKMALRDLAEIGVYPAGAYATIGALIYLVATIPPYLSKPKPAKTAELTKKINFVR